MTLSGLGHRLLDFIFPPICAVCEEGLPSGSETPACPACWDSFKGSEAATPSFMGTGGHFTTAFSLYPFNPPFQKLIHLLKYDKKPSVGRALGTRLAEAVPESFVKGIDAVVPVPIHHTRRRERGYNQSEMIAQAFADKRGLRMKTKALMRVRSTGTQTELNREERQKNIAGAFLCGDGIKGLKVLLVDDVFTTGATLDECARVLKEAGAVEVRVMTAGRA